MIVAMDVRRIAVAAAVVLGAGCTAASPTSADARAAEKLGAAAEATLAADSFHVQMTQQLPTGSGTATADYQAPDREVLRRNGGRGPFGDETISIGDTVYLSAPRRDYFWEYGAGVAGRATSSGGSGCWRTRGTSTWTVTCIAST